MIRHIFKDCLISFFKVMGFFLNYFFVLLFWIIFYFLFKNRKYS